MNVFKKLFSGSNNSEDNANSEYLNNAYSSLGNEENLNPDRIMEENSIVPDDRPEVFEDFENHQDTEGDFGMSETESLEYLEDKESDYEEYDEETSAYDVLSEVYDAENDLGLSLGDTGELDAEKIREEAERVDNYISSLEVADFDFESVDDAGDSVRDENDSYNAEQSEMHSEELDEPDKDLVYSAYAPKSMRPQITQTEYYDLDDIDAADEKENKKSGFSEFVRKRAKWIAGSAAAAVLVVGIIVACVFAFSGGMDPLMGYSQTNAVKGNVIKTMAAGGNVEPNARYEITSLVNGTVTESPLNAGEAVKTGELVYKVDDTNAQIAVQMAQNAVERARVTDSSSSDDNLNIYANASGTITDLRISSGSTITGGQIATITQSNGTEIGLIPSVTGTVQSLNVREGSSVRSGQVIATLRSSGSSSQEGQRLDVAGSQLALEQAQKELEKYKIASPIDGTILVKNAKIGDNVTAGKTDTPLMIIADMSKMKFTIEVDELDIWNIQLGQTVVITANALPGETFSGEITNIAGEGEKKGSGVTTYAVEITISDPGKIKSGMNVDAKIIINSAINVVTLPEQALYESDGKNALVVTNSSSVKDENVMNPEDYPNIAVPQGYRLVKVRYGVNDGTNVEIISGISVGDVVLYKEGEDSNLNEAMGESEASNSSNSSGSNSSNNSNSNNHGEDLSDSDNSGDDSNESDNVRSTGRSALQNEFDL